MKKQTILLLTLILFLALPNTIFAVPPTPSDYWGVITLDGANVPDGTLVSAWINGVKYAEVSTITESGTSYYNIIVSGDDPDTTSIIEGGVNGDIVELQVNGQTMQQTGTWIEESTTQIDLALFSTTPPTPTFTPTPTATPTATPNPDTGLEEQGSAFITLLGHFFISIQNIYFPDTQLTGQTVSVDANPTTWTVGDQRGTNEGWEVNMRAEGDFTSPNGTIPLNGFMIQIPDNHITSQSANSTPPQSWVPTYTSLSTSGIRILSAPPNTGQGVFDIAPQFRLIIPAETVAGNYETDIYVTIIAGP